MKVLIIGAGAREHALAWKISQSMLLEKLYCAPSNPGIDDLAIPVNIPVERIEDLCQFAIAENIDLTIVGPEQPLALGIVDRFLEAGLKIFGPTKDAARLETSKTFAKNLMQKYNIPTAKFHAFNRLEEALFYASNQAYPLVVKDDGLAAGKGVRICATLDEAKQALEDIFAAQNKTVVIEEFLTGREVSVFGISDGKKILPLIPVKDHKQIYDGNTGPNTGGMGTYHPVPFWDQELYDSINVAILQKTLDALNAEGINYKGVIFAGLMISKNNEIKVLEYNCRFGDPETQVIMSLMESDLLEIIMQAALGHLLIRSVSFKKQAAVCVVGSSKGYPGEYEKGKPIEINAEFKENTRLFIAGASKDDQGRLVTNGGRVLNVVSVADTLQEAFTDVYNEISKVSFDGMYFRTDIAREATSTSVKH